MKNNNPSNARRIRFDNCLRHVDLHVRADLVPSDDVADNDDFQAAQRVPDKGLRVLLDTLVREHRSELVVAARNLGLPRHQAEDLVQQLCIEVLEGELALPVSLPAALEVFLGEIHRRCDEEGGAQ
jgi:hypothetical protein